MHVQGTVDGYGDAPATPSCSRWSPLELKYGWPLFGRIDYGGTRSSHAIAEVTNVHPALVGLTLVCRRSPNTAGLHASAIKVDPNLYQHIDPERRQRHADACLRHGRSGNIQIKGAELGSASDRELAARITDRVKDAEAAGYTYEAADASFELLLRRELGQLPGVLHGAFLARCSPSRRNGAARPTPSAPSADGKGQRAVVGEGNGPVNALDHGDTRRTRRREPGAFFQ